MATAKKPAAKAATKKKTKTAAEKRLEAIAAEEQFLDNSIIISKTKLRRYVIYAAAAAVLLLVIFLVWQTMDARKEAERLSDPKNATQNANEEIIKAVEKIYIVPEGEEPTIADVTDKNKLNDKAFFEKAENGDKVLVYPKSQLAVIYRPSSKKLVNIATLDAQTSNTTTSPNPVTPAPAQ